MDGYYILENGARKGPYTINDLTAKSISADTQIWENVNALPCYAKDIPELQILFQNPQASRNPVTDDFEAFGYTIASNDERKSTIKASRPFLIFIVLMYLVIPKFLPEENNFISIFFISLALIFIYYLFNIFYYVPKHSAFYEQKKTGMKLILSSNGKDLSALAKENKAAAYKIILKYITPSYNFLRNGNFQTTSEKKAGLYLVKTKN